MITARNVFQQLTSGPGIMDNVCNFIIRPPRSEYEMEELGPEVFRLGDDGKQRFMRHDFELENMRGLRIQCSWFKPYPDQRTPCVVYCHGNCGSRYDALEALFVLGEGMSLFSFDFCGSGMSEGEYISLGFYERQDLAAVMEFLMLKSDAVDGVALWGRSMGAVTSIMYAAKDPLIRCIVCDSPFATLRVLINDLVERHGGRTARVVPNVVVRAIVERIRKRIMKRAVFDIDDLDTVKYARLCRVPALLFYGSEDDFVTSRHGELIRDAFPIPCLQQYTPGGHNDERDEDIQKVIAAFLHLYLIDKPNGERELRAQQDMQSAPAAASTPAAASPSATDQARSMGNDNNSNANAPSPRSTETCASSSSTSSASTSSSLSRSSSASPTASAASAISSELRRDYSSLQTTSSLSHSGVETSAEAREAPEARKEDQLVPATAIGVDESSPLDAGKKKELNKLPDCRGKTPSSPATDNFFSRNAIKPPDSAGASLSPLPQLQPLPHRPVPFFSATKNEARVVPSSRSPVLRTASRSARQSSPGRMPKL
ncbi:hypothetical protein ABB37_02745 [Leptomonas pyrrhocoris]|uniref:Serine aminopeptidase S33 domain-containing protein n=1 Tax=Leptomonas pyrrhocoris TaxID=157538 RepID=A0A0N0DXI2_LEPPY|nr:hypothetical protein ABB37_02745 [Leptomonas pyrrhocoris]KPA83015.1 hypothetical protein ABB37_02745 [Leptomonas pyrrhocoris]|eukprot:XP_015661454.1 hypothetical protein ABB37_02745 [Leptomonas pyrrhocoris]